MKEKVFEIRTPEKNILVGKGIETADGRFYLEFANGGKKERISAVEFLGRCILFHQEALQQG